MPDFEIWDQLLSQYVDDQGRVDYARWQVEARSVLQDWLQQTSTMKLVELDRNQQLALWLNLYNALVIDQVLAVYPIASIRPTILGLPNWLAFLRFFDRPIYQLDGCTYSLNDIEHGTIRTQFREPRIHFALVCAAVGCPLLRNQAYQPDQVEAQLEADAQRFIRNPAKVRYETPVLYCSKIFQWYQKDFGGTTAGVARFIQPYLGVDLPESVTVRNLPYDWRLNQRTSS
jgi:Protein of unknown function, DUF547